MSYCFQFIRKQSRTELILISSNSEVAAVISSKNKKDRRKSGAVL